MYWIGGAGNWNDPSHWSFTSGGAAGSCIPGPGNDVFFDANSFTNVSKTVTMNVSTASCKSMSWTGAGFTPTFASSSSTNTLKIYGSVTLIAAMNFNYDGGVSFESKTTGNTITSAGHVWPTAMYNNSQISFNGVGGSWSFQDAFSTNYIISLVNGTLNTNNQAVTCFYFESQYNNTRALNLGSSTWTCTGYYWLISGSGMTLNAGTSTIRITYCCFDYFYGGGLTYNNVSLEGTSGTNSIQYSNIFNGTVTILGDGEIGSSNTFNGNLIFTPGKIYTLGAGQTQTIGASGSLTANGTCASYIMIASGQPGTQATITKVNGNLTADNTILRDINATVSIGFQANATNKSTDLGGNANWNFGTNSGTNMYWVGGSGNWSDPNHWSLSSGGPAGVCIPGPTDNVNFDANSFTNASKNVTLDVTNALCRNMNWTGAGFTPTFQYSVSGYLRIYGSLTLISAMNFNYYGQLNFESGSAGNTITTAGHSIGAQVTFIGGSGGSWSLQDGFTTTSLLQLTSGTLNTNNQPVSCLYFVSSSGQPRALNLGSSIFTVTDYYWYVDSYNFTFNAGTSTIHQLNQYPYYGYPVYGAGLTYYNVTFESGSYPGTLQGPGTFNGVVTFNGTGQIDGNNTFNGNVVFLSDGNITSNNTFNSELKFTSGKTYTVASGATQTFSSTGTLSFIAIGSPCAPIAISSSVNGSVTTFTKASGEVCADYLYLNSVKATGGATWSAGLHSTNTTPATGTGWQNTLCSQPLQSSIITPSGPLCGAGSVTLSSRLASSYLWSTGATTQSIVISTPGTYTLSIVNLNGCTESGSLTIVSSAIPTCSITGSTSTCPSANETYTGPAGMAGYAWSITGPGSIPGSAIGSSVGIVPTGCGSYDLSVTVSNSAGCTSTCNIITAVVDNTPPTITCPANISTANATGLCGKNVTFNVTASDNCGSPAVVSTPASGSFFNTGTTTVTSVATDACGNSTSCTFTVTVSDNEAPVLSVPAAITINTDAGLCTSTASIGTATATDNCGTVTISHSPLAPYAMGNTTVTWTAVDGQGFTTTGTQVVTVHDNQAPTISVPAAITISADAGLCTSTASIGTATGTDLCGTVTISHSPAAPYAFGNTTVTWTANDGNGNTTTGTQIVTVTENQAPTISVPAAITINTDAGLCTSTANIGTAIGTDNCGSVTISHSPAAPYALGNTTVTWTADDGHGNTTTGTQIVTVHDNQAPTISVPAAITINTDAGLCTSTAGIGTATGTDLCSTVTISHSPAAPYALGNTTVTWTADDGNGNTTSGTQVVTVTDNEAPFISVPAAITISADPGLCTSTASIGTATGTDICGTVTISHTPLAPYALGNTTVTWTANDGHGNTTSGTQVVTVADNQAPTISVPAAITIYADAGLCTSTAGIGTATGADICGSVTISHSPAAPYALGNTTVTWTADDGHGNTTTGTQVVTVLDNQAPTISVPAAVTISADAGLCTSTGSIGTATGSDNCGSVTISHSPAAPYALGNTTVTWTANDGHGNTTSGTQVVTVTDNEAPSINVPAAVTISADAGQCTSTASIGTATGTDNCGTVTISHSPSAPYALGNTTVTWTANDGHGNTTSGTQVVTVTDNQAPSITVPAATTISANAGQCTSTASIGTATGSDNCGSVTISHSPAAPYALGNTTVTWTANDGHGNTTSGTQVVTVTDNEAPAITVPAAITLSADAGLCSSSASIGTATGTDNCGTVTISHTPLAPYAVGNTTVTWTANDGHGNTTSGTQVVTVNDNEAPHAVCQNYTLNLSGGTGSITAANIDNGSTDNCGIATKTVSPSSFTCANAGANTVTLTVTDIHGNSSSCTATVTVQYQPTCSIAVTPANNTYTGGDAHNIYFGYGPQSATFTSTATGGSGFTYSWSPSTYLSATNVANPTFTPTAAGHYTYTCTATNSNGCSTTCTVSMCVVDAVDHSHANKVILCHIPPGNPNNPQQLSISVNAVDAHLTGHTGDHLGACYGGCGSGAKSVNNNVVETSTEAIKVYPNPNEGVFNVEIPVSSKTAEIMITDITGRVIETRSVSENTGAPVQFSLLNVAKGIYFVKVKAGDDVYVNKLIVR
jgi:HYR domain/Secretion system C-terminal sorting domain